MQGPHGPLLLYCKHISLMKYMTDFRRNIAVETVKELMMSEDDKKIPEDKDGERTDTSMKTDTSVPLTEPPKSPGQKQRNRSARYTCICFSKCFCIFLVFEISEKRKYTTVNCLIYL